MAGNVVLFEGFANDFFADAVGIDVCCTGVSYEKATEQKNINNFILVLSRKAEEGATVSARLADSSSIQRRPLSLKKLRTVQWQTDFKVPSLKFSKNRDGLTSVPGVETLVISSL